MQKNKKKQEHYLNFVLSTIPILNSISKNQECKSTHIKNYNFNNIYTFEEKELETILKDISDEKYNSSNLYVLEERLFKLLKDVGFKVKEIYLCVNLGLCIKH